MVKSTMFKKKPEEAEKELMKISRTEGYFHPVEAFSAMSESMKKQSESFSTKPYIADSDVKTAAKADKLRMASQTPVEERYYHLVKSLKG